MRPRVAGLPRKGVRRQPLRLEAPVPADPELRDVPVFVACRDSAAPEAAAHFAAYPAAAAGGRGADRRDEQDHRHDGSLHQPDPGAVHVHPEGRCRPIALADGSITSPFLALFGRSARATGMTNEREQQAACPPNGCTCSIRATSSASWNKGPGLRAIFSSGRKPAEIVETLYLTILSRFRRRRKKTVAERRATYDARQPSTGQALDRPEFLYRH